MDEWLKFAQAAVPTAAAFVALVFLGPGKYLGIQHVRLSMASKKRKNLDMLIRSGRWRTALAIEIELAIKDAFGYEMDAQLVRFTFLRRNALQQLRYLRKCQLMVKLSSDGLTLESAKRSRRSFRFCTVAASILSFLPLILILVFLPFLKAHVPPQIIGMLAGFAFAWMPTMIWVADGFDSAHRLTARSSQYYPLDVDSMLLTSADEVMELKEICEMD